MWNARSFIDSNVSVTSKNPWQIETTLSIENNQLWIVIEDDLTIATT